jgi:hypothetical protein
MVVGGPWEKKSPWLATDIAEACCVLIAIGLADNSRSTSSSGCSSSSANGIVTFPHAGDCWCHQVVAPVLAFRKAEGRTAKDTPGNLSQATMGSQKDSGLLAQGSTARST